jgi:hypothetical protein
VKAIVIKVKEVPIKVYNNIKKVEWYYILLYCIYEIISLKLKGASKELSLQIAVKAVNNSASPDRLIFILLVFSTYP